MKQPNTTLSNTKKKILEAAGPIFGKAGFESATVREICTQAGVNVAAVNYHFGYKKGLYLATLEYWLKRVTRKYPLELGWERSSSPEERLKIFVSQFVSRIHEAHHGKVSWFRNLIMMELIKPSEGLDIVIREVAKPSLAVLSGIAGELMGKGATEKTIRLCCASIVGQSLFFFYAQPIIRRLSPVDISYFTDAKALADHITHFSLEAIKAFGTKKQGDKP
jgi:AcrR family transcriptional regulator